MGEGSSVPVTSEPCLSPALPPGLPTLLPAESKAFASNLPTLSVAKAAASGPGKSSGLQVRGPQSGGLGLQQHSQGLGRGCGAGEADRQAIWGGQMAQIQVVGETGQSRQDIKTVGQRPTDTKTTG